MDIGLNVGAKRSWDGASDGEIVETAQIKFKRLLERNQASKFASAVKTKEEITNITLKLVDEHLSFEEILRESEDICSVQCGSHQEKPELYPELYSVSALTVDSCVDLLKGQAAKASCSLDLLAAESLGRRLVTVCSSASKQLLTKCQLESAHCVVSVIKHMVANQCFNRVYFTKHLTSKGPCLPLEVVWMLHKDCIVSFDTYLACCLQCNETVEMISSGLTALCTSISNKEKQESILSVLLGRLVSFSFLENKAKEGSNNRLDKISQEILDIIVERSDFLANKKMDECPPQKDDAERFCVLEVVRRLNDIPWAAIKKFFSRQLNVFFMKQTDTETQALDYQDFCNQNKLTFSALNQTVRTVIEQFLLVFDPLTVMECLKNALFKDQVNVRSVLSFLSSFVVLVKEAASMIEGYVYDLLNASLNNNDINSLRVAFLMIRQMSLEGGHVFEPYVTWFQSKFGDQGNMKLTKKKSVQFFMKFLSDLVPYEPAEYLKVHILKAPQVPSKLRDIVTDYVCLAKTRLMDLKEPVELMAMYGDSSGTSGTETKSEHTKQLEQASADVEKVLESYEKSGKVPGTVMEASIFRKPYFIGRFLPALLTPRKVPDEPDEPDSRAQLIDVLSKAGKIPKSMLSAYQSACEKMTTEQIEVSSSDDEGALSGMEKLISCLDKFTKLIVESLKSTDLSKQSGRISSQLSIISATIQLLTKISNEILMTNQLVEVDIDNLDNNISTQVVDALLDAFCRTCAAVKKCPSDSLDHLNLYHWVGDFVDMVVSIATLHRSLYCQLWRKTCLEGATSNKEDTHGLAVFLCYLCINHAIMLPIILKGIYRRAEKNFPDVFTICSFVDVLCEHIPLCTSRWMAFFLRFSCSHMDHALEVFNTNVTELKANVGRHTAYLSPMMLKKTFYLFHRLNVYGETRFYKPTLPEDLVCMVSSLVSVQQFQQLKEKEEKLMFSEWCRWELSMSARDDFLPDTDRRIYHQFRVLEHYLPLGTLEGGCHGCARKACSVIFHALLDSESRCPQDQTDRDVSRNDVISLIQELVPLLPKMTGDSAAHKTGENPCEPWLLEQFNSRLSQLQFKVENSKAKTSQNSDLLRASEIISFMNLAVRLPSYLLFTDALDSVPDVYSIKRVVAFINSNLRPFLSEGCCLPFDATLYIFKALLTYTRGSSSYSRLPASSQLVSECFKDSPLLFVSLQHYWKQLRPLAAAQFDVTCGALKQAELLFNWKNRIETTQNVSLRELESLEVYVVASCIAVYLRDVNSKVMALFVEESKSPTEFTRKLAVCLFDCIMADFSWMVLHGHEIEENAVLRDFAWKLFRCFPRTLLVFKMDENCEFKEDLIRLRSLILKEQLITLYPAVFFSFFTNFPSESLREVTRMSGFLEVTLYMYNSFVYLRKQCLDGVANKTAVCSPLHLDFCRQVSVFVRDCVLCSPEEHLRRLSKDVISSCTSELRQFLQSQLSRFPERKN